MQNYIGRRSGHIAWRDGSKLTRHVFKRQNIQLQRFDHTMLIAQSCEINIFFTFGVYTGLVLVCNLISSAVCWILPLSFQQYAPANF